MGGSCCCCSFFFFSLKNESDVHLWTQIVDFIERLFYSSPHSSLSSSPRSTRRTPAPPIHSPLNVPR